MTLKRNVFNKLMLLKLIELNKGIDGATRMQKYVFEIETKLRKERVPTFNYNFIRWNYGPFSKELIEDIEFLIGNDLVRKINRENNTVSYQITGRGRDYINKASRTYPDYFKRDFLLRKVLQGVSRLTLNELLEKVYKENNVVKYKMGEVIEPVQ